MLSIKSLRSVVPQTLCRKHSTMGNNSTYMNVYRANLNFNRADLLRITFPNTYDQLHPCQSEVLRVSNELLQIGPIERVVRDGNLSERKALFLRLIGTCKYENLSDGHKRYIVNTLLLLKQIFCEEHSVVTDDTDSDSKYATYHRDLLLIAFSKKYNNPPDYQKRTLNELQKLSQIEKATLPFLDQAEDQYVKLHRDAIDNVLRNGSLLEKEMLFLHLVGSSTYDDLDQETNDYVMRTLLSLAGFDPLF